VHKDGGLKEKNHAGRGKKKVRWGERGRRRSKETAPGGGRIRDPNGENETNVTPQKRVNNVVKPRQRISRKAKGAVKCVKGKITGFLNW